MNAELATTLFKELTIGHKISCSLSWRKKVGYYTIGIPVNLMTFEEITAIREVLSRWPITLNDDLPYYWLLS